MYKTTINYVQPRVATGYDDSEKSTVYVFSIFQEAYYTASKEETMRMPRACPKIAEVEIIHPFCMAGSWDDIERQWYRKVENKLLEDGILEMCETNGGREFAFVTDKALKST